MEWYYSSPARPPVSVGIPGTHTDSTVYRLRSSPGVHQPLQVGIGEAKQIAIRQPAQYLTIKYQKKYEKLKIIEISSLENYRE